MPASSAAAVEVLTRAASFEPSTFNEERRSIEVTFATDADVMRQDFEGPFIERLDLSPDAVDLASFRGAPVLDNHNRFGSVSSILGIVESASTDGRRGAAVIRFGERPEIQGIVADVRSGVIRNVSVGYKVRRWEVSKRADGVRVKTAADWVPVEASFTQIGADPNARVRSESMPDTQAVSEQIRSMASVLGLPATFADGLIERNLTIEQARTEAVQELARAVPSIDARSPARVTRETSPYELARQMGEGLAARHNSDVTPSEAARQYAGERFPNLARRLLEAQGVSTLGMSEGTIIRQAMTTSDFPVLLSEFANKNVMSGYRQADSGIVAISKRTTAPDFRDIHNLWLAETPRLEKIDEEGEIRFGALTEGEQKFRLARFGKGLAISYVLQVNDSLGAVVETMRNWGFAVREMEASEIAAVLTANSGNGVTLSDNKALFHADHGNKAGTGAAPSETTLDAGRLAMRKQKTKGGYPLGIAPKYVVVPPELETAVKKLTSPITPGEVETVNPFSDLTPIVDVRLTNATRWYLFADPAAAPVLVHAYLEGENGPRIESKVDFHTDATLVKCTMSFGAGVLDFIGGYMNPGA
jgi:hypothetical protein